MKRGRKSAAELVAGPIRIDRPEPPYVLSDEEVAVWRQIVHSLEPDYFAPSHFALLTQLCRHTVASNRVAMLIEQCCKQKKLDQRDFAALLALQNSESGSIIRLSRSLRLSPQSVYRADAPRNRPISAAFAPWHKLPTDAAYDSPDDEKD